MNWDGAGMATWEGTSRQHKTLGDLTTNDQLITCEICGIRIESEKKDDHLYSEHGISI